MLGNEFDPRDLISGPWRACPACGKDKFGVINIGGSRLTRRCRDCWHGQEYRLPELRKKIIYLDQFVVSNLMKLENRAIKGHANVAADPFWRELHDLLFQLIHLQMICCPDSGSHEEESRIAPFNPELKKTYEALSGGITFKAFDSIKSNQIAELATAWAEEREPSFDFESKKVLSRNPNEWNERFYVVVGDNPFISPAELRRVRTELHANIARLFRDVWGKEKQSFEYWYELERKGFQGHLLNAAATHKRERAKVISAFKPGEEPSLEALDKLLPSFPERIIEGIESIMRFPRGGGLRSPEEQAELVRSFLSKNRTAEAPFVKLQSLLFAAIAVRAERGQKEPPNQGTATDIDTLSHLLPFCDAMFMDNGCRSLLQNIPGKLRPPETAKVYSPNVKAEFLNYLRSIRDGISAEHVQAIREVYGAAHLGGVPSAQGQ
ncbi:MAG TPA: hypothetical protein VNM47_13705 [Terriglobia bacterium]|nr:hypothetical protein [Terriglobia bacterium]